MLYLKSFCFGPFQENTYIIYDDKGEAFIIDPGNSTNSENESVKNFIAEKNLKLTRLLLTHAHIDHILGNKFIFDTYGLLPEVNKEDLFFIDRMAHSANLYGLNFEQSPDPVSYINEGDKIQLGEYIFDCIYTPGHSPGSISFYNAKNKILISGDVLFNGSIGRYDLPKGDLNTLMSSITEKLFVLPDDVKVYSGHGPATTIGHEKATNPFF
ncbi:MAG: beta-lactamase domain protein [Bacteroidetes bacterium]|jgi:glyoxylase-like metal-dependent hydrolase (beta-lactamase superfamily II)|nr:beta-lactamase domain protein [Bacteroidota bacterium]